MRGHARACEGARRAHIWALGAHCLSGGETSALALKQAFKKATRANALESVSFLDAVESAHDRCIWILGSAVCGMLAGQGVWQSAIRCAPKRGRPDQLPVD